MHVRELMTDDVISVEKDENLDGVLEVMRSHDVTKLPVTRNGDALGFVSDAEIATALGARKNKGIPPRKLYASSVVVRDPETVSPDDPVQDVVRICRQTGVPIVLVVDDGDLAGVVTKCDLLDLVDASTPLSNVATRDVVAVAPDDRIVHARRQMLDHGIERLPVLDEDELVGVIAEADVAYAFQKFKKHVPVNHQQARLDEFYVAEAMVRDVHTADPETTAQHAAQVMTKTGVGCLPLLDDGELAGIVTRTDLIREI